MGSSPQTTAKEEEATVLVVDDEVDLADLLATYPESEYRFERQRTAKRLSYWATTKSTSSARSAAARIGWRRDARQTRRRGIDTRVAVLTGVAPDTDIIEMPFGDFRRKPFTREDILGQVEVLLVRSDDDEHSRRYFRLATKNATFERADQDRAEKHRDLVD